jgi:NAD(P)-dependent dehydrogenase (short-subunit alcohol dehydrogenase family)
MWPAGRTAVVTGVARPHGIGAACAQLLHARGFHIIGLDSQPVVDSNPALPWADAAELAAADGTPQGPGPSCAALQVDLAQLAGIQRVLACCTALGWAACTCSSTVQPQTRSPARLVHCPILPARTHTSQPPHPALPVTPATCPPPATPW